MTTPEPERGGPRARSLGIAIALGLGSGLLLALPLTTMLVPESNRQSALLGLP